MRLLHNKEDCCNVNSFLCERKDSVQNTCFAQRRSKLHTFDALLLFSSYSRTFHHAVWGQISWVQLRMSCNSFEKKATKASCSQLSILHNLSSASLWHTYPTCTRQPVRVPSETYSSKQQTRPLSSSYRLKGQNKARFHLPLVLSTRFHAVVLHRVRAESARCNRNLCHPSLFLYKLRSSPLCKILSTWQFSSIALFLSSTFLTVRR